jgi:hypothetical protein
MGVKQTFALREEHKLRAVDKRTLRRIFGTENGSKKMVIIIRRNSIVSRRTCSTHGEVSNTHKISVEEHEAERLLLRSSHREEDNIKMNSIYK